MMLKDDKKIVAEWASYASMVGDGEKGRSEIVRKLARRLDDIRSKEVKNLIKLVKKDRLDKIYDILYDFASNTFLPILMDFDPRGGEEELNFLSAMCPSYLVARHMFSLSLELTCLLIVATRITKEDLNSNRKFTLVKYWSNTETFFKLTAMESDVIYQEVKKFYSRKVIDIIDYYTNNMLDCFTVMHEYDLRSWWLDEFCPSPLNVFIVNEYAHGTYEGDKDMCEACEEHIDWCKHCWADYMDAISEIGVEKEDEEDEEDNEDSIALS